MEHNTTMSIGLTKDFFILMFFHRNMKICYWFYNNNRDDHHGLRYCRHGSLCRFRHLTQEEVNVLNSDPEGLVDCPRCRGTGEMKIKVFGIRVAGGETPIPCIGCNGSKTTTKKKVILGKVEGREYCHCRHPDDGNTRYYADNQHPKCSKHCYVCTRCNGISQVG